IFYLTGLNVEGVSKHTSLLSTVQSHVKKISKINESMNSDSIIEDGEESSTNNKIKFNYILYENQRRWIGIGWTPSMLSYERSSWTDEFLNPSLSPEEFELPESQKNMKWKWVDRSWRLDMTNDGMIQLSSNKAKTVAFPNSDDGYIYYDNTWKKPSTVDSFSKYTRRRRWIRTAELIRVSNYPFEEGSNTNGNGVSNGKENTDTREEEGEEEGIMVEPEQMEEDGSVDKNGTDRVRQVSFSTKDIIYTIAPNNIKLKKPVEVTTEETREILASENTHENKGTGKGKSKERRIEIKHSKV
ncbi:hypothetical protein Kpol_1062p44, partial [Vanderwaltozyma polyspora DSM 70294]